MGAQLGACFFTLCVHLLNRRFFLTIVHLMNRKGDTMNKAAFALSELAAVIMDAWNDADLVARLRAWWGVASGRVLTE